VQSSGLRTSPDVSYDASPSTGYYVYDSFGNSQNSWVMVGGTSAAAPQWAALLAIANQGRALEGLGTLDGPSQTLPKLYAMPSSDFHDTTSGSNVGASATPGYDQVTGLGSPYADRVVAALTQEPLHLLSPSVSLQDSSTQGSASAPTGSQSPVPQPPSPSQPPPAQQPVTAPSPTDEVAADALLVAEGLASDDLSLILLGLANFESLFWSSSAAIQPQLQFEFIDQLVNDLF
jgi:hypothetical protein